MQTTQNWLHKSVRKLLLAPEYLTLEHLTYSRLAAIVAKVRIGLASVNQDASFADTSDS